jgi:hypothetical protein
MARVYNHELGSGTNILPNNGSLLAEITDTIIYDAFYLHALLRDKLSRHELLHLPNRGIHNRWFDQAMQERNLRYAGNGQPLWGHACKRCMHIIEEDGIQSM